MSQANENNEKKPYELNVENLFAAVSAVCILLGCIFATSTLPDKSNRDKIIIIIAVIALLLLLWAVADSLFQYFLAKEGTKLTEKIRLVCFLVLIAGFVICLGIISLFTLSATPKEDAVYLNMYDDVNETDDIYWNAIEQLGKLQYMNNYEIDGKSKFLPENNLTRAEFAYILGRLGEVSKYPIDNGFEKGYFQDTNLEEDDPLHYSVYITKCMQYYVLRLYGANGSLLDVKTDDLFDKEKPVTYEEFVRTLQGISYPLVDQKGIFPEITQKSSEIPSWKKDEPIRREHVAYIIYENLKELQKDLISCFGKRSINDPPTKQTYNEKYYTTSVVSLNNVAEGYLYYEFKNPIPAGATVTVSIETGKYKPPTDVLLIHIDGDDYNVVGQGTGSESSEWTIVPSDAKNITHLAIKCEGIDSVTIAIP